MSGRPWEFPVLRRPVTIVTDKGEKSVEGACLGGLAVTPTTETFAGGRRAFVVTQIASGARIAPAGWYEEAAAITALRVLVALGVDWSVAAPKKAVPAGFGGFLGAMVHVTGGFKIEYPIDAPAGGHA